MNSNNFISYDTPDHRSAAAHGVFDSKLGATKDQECQTCKQNFKDCPGHFGYIPVSNRLKCCVAFFKNSDSADVTDFPHRIHYTHL